MTDRPSFEAQFPFSAIRDEQRTAIEFVLNAFQNGKRFCIIELGTGCGKSAVAVTVARYMAQFRALFDLDPERSGAYVLTTQKILQQQYIDDFGEGSLDLLRSVKSSSNYTCVRTPTQSCAESRRVLSVISKTSKASNVCSNNCPYQIEKREFIDCNIGVTNFSYFLAETMYAGKIKPRSLLIIDECHNTESELGKFIEITFSERFTRDVLGCKLPKSRSQESIVSWVKKTYKPALNKKIKVLKSALTDLIQAGALDLGDKAKQYEMLDKHVCKVNRFLDDYQPKFWVMNTLKKQSRDKGSSVKFEFKPIDVSKYSGESLFKFGDKVLMMSATILDKDVFCSSIGIDPSDAEFLRLPSPFPTENKPIHYMPVGSMSARCIDRTLPLMASAVKAIIEQHADDKGIIHCTNYRVAQYLYEHVGSERLLTHSSENRDLVLNTHIAGSSPTILLSPSMMEGVNLVDDASRFQILCKIPFPYLGDDVIKRRMERNPAWYPFQTAKSIIQSMGRSVRSETDHAVSYILDEDWATFYRRNRALFPDDFIRSLM